jgi:hypothetical protein
VSRYEFHRTGTGRAGLGVRSRLHTTPPPGERGKFAARATGRGRRQMTLTVRRSRPPPVSPGTRRIRTRGGRAGGTRAPRIRTTTEFPAPSYPNAAWPVPRGSCRRVRHDSGRPGGRPRRDGLRLAVPWARRPWGGPGPASSVRSSGCSELRLDSPFRWLRRLLRAENGGYSLAQPELSGAQAPSGQRVVGRFERAEAASTAGRGGALGPTRRHRMGTTFPVPGDPAGPSAEVGRSETGSVGASRLPVLPDGRPLR